MIRNYIIVTGLALLVAGCGTSREQAQAGSTVPPTTTAEAPAATMPQRTARAATNVQALPVKRDTVRHLQAALKVKGFYEGPVDGIVGRRTRTALADFQQSQGRQRTAALDPKTLQELTAGTTTAANAANSGNEGNTGKEANSGNEGSGNEANAASGSSTGPMMSPDQVKDQLQSQGWSNVSDVRPWGDDAFTARAEKNGQTQTVEVNGHTGQVFGAQ